ncbi:unnamed protein product [Bursaphelenchus okinawaensis]|uniref:EGF-like domain-containing protein n=1 Tax=Bursaphelenchus okinawaensis TaxID=465554 RepID=A0A811LAC7_9BILA|nr:unnamed protein product [Bursaphelenchus okinawaensis]CAG9120050.1 unnamed protein product [Bursaphelenchus okinawaensis]
MANVLRVLIFSSCYIVLAEKSDSNSKEETDFTRTDHDLRFVWQKEMETFYCCNDGSPEAIGLAKNFTVLGSSPRDSQDVSDFNCQEFKVSYLARRSRYLSDAEDDTDEEHNRIRCKCPVASDHMLDEHCRRLPACKNLGVRTVNNKCLCPVPFFGDLCEKYCDQGQIITGQNGRNYCSCVPYYQGEECRDLICMNGGRETNGRCVCPRHYLGYHCEINTNSSTQSSSRFQRFGDQGSDMFTRDISGTIFSLIMIVVLVVSMYLLMKHRMQTRYLNRRPDLLTACNFPVPVPAAVAVAANHGPGGCFATRRGDFDDPRIYSFRQIIPDSGPPPYIQPGQRRRRSQDEALPPLPSYEDATKLPPLRHNLGEENASDDNVESGQGAAISDDRAETPPTSHQNLATSNQDEDDAQSEVPETSSLSSGGSSVSSKGD